MSHLLFFAGRKLLIGFHLTSFHVLSHAVKIGAKFQPDKTGPAIADSRKSPPLPGSQAASRKLESQHLGAVLKDHVHGNAGFIQAVQIRLQLGGNPSFLFNQLGHAFVVAIALQSQN